jgi:hypothetical protein
MTQAVRRRSAELYSAVSQNCILPVVRETLRAAFYFGLQIKNQLCLADGVLGGQCESSIHLKGGPDWRRDVCNTIVTCTNLATRL